LRLSLVLVAHRSAELLPAAIGSFRAEAAACGVGAEVVVVEQSEDAAQVRRVERLGVDRLEVRPNRGYAAGVNAGCRAASGESLILANPDVRFGAGSVGALLDALRQGWQVVGPQLELEGFLYPPADAQLPGEECRRWLASRSKAAWRWHLRGELRRWLGVWTAGAPVEVATLSGALLAVGAETAAAAGPWDEDYFLYFEETDWLRRARRRGLRLALAPGARVEHLWGRAADPQVHAATFGRSRRRYFTRHFGRLGGAVSRLQLARTPLRPAPLGADELDAARGAGWLLVSPAPLGFPAAGLPPGGAAAERLAGLVRRSGHLGSWTLLAYEPRTGALRGPWRWAPRPPG
jgi:GT2 family glycosyltransferase